MDSVGTPKFNLAVIEKLQAENAKLVERCAEIGGERDVAYGENEKLKELLGKHGRHAFMCNQACDPKKACDCGWGAVFEEYLPCQPTA